jgi:hypothetical protein
LCALDATCAASAASASTHPDGLSAHATYVLGHHVPLESAAWEMSNEYANAAEMDGRDADSRWERSKPLGGLRARLANKATKDTRAAGPRAPSATHLSPQAAGPATIPTQAVPPVLGSGAYAPTAQRAAGAVGEAGGRGSLKGRGRGRGRGQPMPAAEVAHDGAEQGRVQGGAAVPRAAKVRSVATAVGSRHGEGSLAADGGLDANVRVAAEHPTLKPASGTATESRRQAHASTEALDGSAELRTAPLAGRGGSAQTTGRGKGKGKGKGRGKGGKAAASASQSHEAVL